MDIQSVTRASRAHLLPLVDQSFTGIYRWHAEKTLRSVQWVREAFREDGTAGLAMLTMLAERCGYVYYIAVAPSERGAGLGGLLLDDALAILKDAGAIEAFACTRWGNAASLRLLRSRSFERTRFGQRVRTHGLVHASILWMRMVAAPGEYVFVKDISGYAAPS